jgi:hypothetical protein
VSIALEKGAESPRINYPPVVVYRFSETSLTAGVEEHRIDGVRVCVYSPEKTIADCFKDSSMSPKDRMPRVSLARHGYHGVPSTSTARKDHSLSMHLDDFSQTLISSNARNAVVRNTPWSASLLPITTRFAPFGSVPKWREDKVCLHGFFAPEGQNTAPNSPHLGAIWTCPRFCPLGPVVCLQNCGLRSENRDR